MKTENFQLKKGATVTIVVQTPWATTEEDGKIIKVTKDKIYLDYTDIPFDKKTGVKTESMNGCKVYIKELK